MQFIHYIHVLWVFVLGIAVVVVGVSLMTSGDYGMLPEIGYDWQTISFGVMMVGLGIGGVGAIRGKRKLRNSLYTESPWFQKRPENPQAYKELKPQIVQQTMQPPSQPAASQPFQKPLQEVQEKKEEPEENQYKLDEIKKELSRRSGSEEEMEDVEHEIVPEDVVRIYVCPKCGFDNPEQNVFCSNCGKKLKTIKAQKGKKEAKKPVRKPKKKSKPSRKKKSGGKRNKKDEQQ